METTSAGGEVYGYPLSFAQRRLWFMDQLFPGTPLYNLPLVLHLALPVDVAVLERALRAMARRHETLRTTFRTVEAGPVQVVHEEADVHVRVVPLDHLPAADREAAAMAFAAADLQQPFDLTTGPLWRVTLVRLGTADHLLLLTAHHIISDGWSMGLMLQELQALYQACATGGTSPLPELPLQYVDYAIWQQEHLSAERVAELLGYWRERLADLPALELPTDRLRPAVASLRGRRHHFELAPQLRTAVDALAHQEQASSFMVLLAAFALLLQRYTGEDDIPIGTPIAGRGRAEFERLIGFFVNTLVLRVEVDGDPTFRHLVRRVRERALEAYTWQDLPFEKLVEDLQPVRDMSRHPLFQVMFALQNAPTAGPESPSSALRSVEIETGLTNFDLALDVWRRGDGYAARLEYNVDLFETATIERLTRHWLTLIDAVVADPDQPVSCYALDPGTDKHPAPDARAYSGDAARSHSDTTAPLSTLIRARADAQPDAPAIVDGPVMVSYRDLHARACALAARLQGAGVGPDVPVAVCLERSASLVVAMLAVWYAGGVYVPIDPRDPDERVAHLLDDIAPPVVLTARRHHARCAALGTRAPRTTRSLVLALDAEPTPAEEGAGGRALTERAGPGDLAYVVYTSGTTGPPRGVAVEHRSLVHHLRWMQTICPLGPGDRTLLCTSIGFDVSLWELTAPLVAGATLVLALDGAEAEPHTLAAFMASQHIVVWQTTPSVLRLMLEAPAFGACDALRVICCGAEVLPRALAEACMATREGTRLCNMYGPTEATIDAAFYVCAMGQLPDTRSGSVPIGRPIDGVRLYVLDRQGRSVPDGLPGELHIAGANLARGYWRDPLLTGQRFVPDPHAPDGARMYRTGDRVRRLPSGDIELLGRLDRQVKVRGVRVEPAEVERALVTHPSVTDAYVTTDRDDGGRGRLIAHVAVPDGGVSGRDLRDHLTRRLPTPMVPSVFVVTDALPRTSRGKVDRQVLARALAAVGTDAGVLVEPRTATEAAVLDIWLSVLGVDRAGVDADFFDLGGHSLMATQVVSRILERLHVVVPLRAFFEQPTVEALAARIDAAVGGDGHYAEAPAIDRHEEAAAAVVSRLSDHEVEQLLRALAARGASYE